MIGNLSFSFRTHHCQVNAFQLSYWFLFMLVAINQGSFVEGSVLLFFSFSRTDLLHTHTVTLTHTWKLDSLTTVWCMNQLTRDVTVLKMVIWGQILCLKSFLIVQSSTWMLSSFIVFQPVYFKNIRISIFSHCCGVEWHLPLYLRVLLNRLKKKHTKVSQRNTQWGRLAGAFCGTSAPV